MSSPATYLSPTGVGVGVGGGGGGGAGPSSGAATTASHHLRPSNDFRIPSLPSPAQQVPNNISSPYPHQQQQQQMPSPYPQGSGSTPLPQGQGRPHLSAPGSSLIRQVGTPVGTPGGGLGLAPTPGGGTACRPAASTPTPTPGGHPPGQGYGQRQGQGQGSIAFSVSGQTNRFTSHQMALTPADVERSLELVLNEKLPELERLLSEVLGRIEGAFDTTKNDPATTEELYSKLISSLQSLIDLTSRTGLGAIPLSLPPTSSTSQTQSQTLTQSNPPNQPPTQPPTLDELKSQISIAANQASAIKTSLKDSANRAVTVLMKSGKSNNGGSSGGGSAGGGGGTGGVGAK